MAREIKFRAFIDNEMVLLPFAALQYFDFEGSYALSFAVDGYSGFHAHEKYESATERYCKNAPIMQYTGLKDKNGVEIYEGDVVKAENWNTKVFHTEFILATVVFSYGQYWLQTPVGLHSLYDTNGDSLYDTNGEVIGNIYQNPELLKH